MTIKENQKPIEEQSETVLIENSEFVQVLSMTQTGTLKRKNKSNATK